MSIQRTDAKSLAGRFVVFEGPDGAGKTTQVARFVQLAKSQGLSVCEARDPGGTAIGERIRSILLEHGSEDIGVMCEMLLYMASRAQLIARRIRPALDEGQLVVCDRFVPSTIAYQGAAGRLPVEHIEAVGRVVASQARPDLVVLLDVDERTAQSRLSPLLDRMEAKGAEFHRRVRASYIEQARKDPSTFAIIDASKDPDVVFEQVLRAVAERATSWSARANAQRPAEVRG